MATITGVTFVRCTNHPDAVARQWHGQGDDRRPYCGACLRPICDAAAVERMRRDPKVSTALDAYATALESGARRERADTRRTVRLYLSLAAVRQFERHLRDLEG